MTDTATQQHLNKIADLAASLADPGAFKLQAQSMESTIAEARAAIEAVQSAMKAVDLVGAVARCQSVLEKLQAKAHGGVEDATSRADELELLRNLGKLREGMAS